MKEIDCLYNLNTVCYKVANHNFRISFPGKRDIAALLPSFEPFRLQETVGKDDSALEVELCNSAFEMEGELIYKYDWDNTYYNFFRTSEGYLINISVGLDSEEKYTVVLCDNFKISKIYFGFGWEYNIYMVKNLIMMLFAFATAGKETLIIHSSVIRKDGRGYMFLGTSGTGKSTHSSLWLKHISETELMNDDNPILRIEDGVVNVFGSPWSGKTHCYKNISAPVGAFVKLNQAPANVITKKIMIQQYAELLASVSSMRWDKRIDEPVCDTIASILNKVSLFHLDCLPDQDAAQLSYTIISADAINRNI